MEWRERWNADKLDTWDPPQILKDYLPFGLSGFDKDGAPVVFVLFSGLDLYGILHVVSRREMVKFTIKALEGYLKLCAEQAKKHGPAANQVTVIFDMEGFSLKQYTWRPAAETVLALIQMYEANYPEVLKTCFIINAPKVFAFAFAIAKKFLNEYTLGKIQIFKADPPKWKSAILKIVPRDQLPVHYGGTLTDPDGNPKLITKICPGGKVSQDMYVEKDQQDENFTTVTIRKGHKLELDIPAEETGSILSWEFRTEDHDIKFGIVKKGTDGANTDIVPLRRVAAHQMEEIGVLNCEVPATYGIIFDNSYSILRNKKLHYSIRVLQSPNVGEEIISTS